MNDHDEQDITNGISRCIAIRLRTLRTEECYPGMSADDSNSKIASLKKQIADLRDIRTQLEEIFCNPGGHA